MIPQPRRGRPIRGHPCGNMVKKGYAGAVSGNYRLRSRRAGYFLAMSTSILAGMVFWSRAAAGGDVDSVHLLLAFGADPSAADGQGTTALDLAERKGRDEIADLIRISTKGGF